MIVRIQCICNCRSNTFLYASLVALAWLLNSSKLLFNYHIREENFIYQVLEYSIRRNFNKTPVNINIFLCELRTQPKLFISSRAWGLCSVKLVFKHKVSEDIKKGYMHRSIGSFDIHPSATHGHLTVVCSGGGGGGNLNLVWRGWGIRIGSETFF